jgi:CRISPR-associated protein Csb2
MDFDLPKPTDDPVADTGGGPRLLEPTGSIGTFRLRVPTSGRLQQLRELYTLSREQGSDLRPTPGAWSAYGAPMARRIPSGSAHSVFDPPFLVLHPAEGEYRRPPLVSTLRLTEALRGLLMNGTPRADIPEALSGHAPNGKRLDRPHLAIVPLPFVGHEHADGRIMGMALILPRDDTDAVAIGNALSRKLYTSDGLEPKRIELKMGGAGMWTLEASDAAGAASLRPEVWSMTPNGAEAWATVTPIVLDRHPKSRQPLLAAAEMQVVIADACVNIGLPRPIKVEVAPVSVFAGVPHARDFPPLRRKDGSAANYTHAVLVFDRRIVGPVLLGAGRYRGYGLCRPVVGSRGGGA